MNKDNFWNKLKEAKQPILALAPMAGFTDSSFRVICKEQGADVLYSEMASVAALYYANRKTSNDRSAQVTKDLLQFNKKIEKNYVVQLFGSEPEHFAMAAKYVSQEIKSDGIDINFGCPVPKVVKQGAGSALMQDLKRSREVIKAVLANTNLPVSIKIRKQAGKVEAIKFLDNISDLPISALMIHGRTLKEGFIGEADHGLAKEAKKHFGGVILTNGGINNLSEAKKALKDSQADGLGLARGVLGRPWLFKEIKINKEIELSNEEIFNLMIKQAEEIVQEKGEGALLEFRKHLAWYTQGRRHAKFLREKLVAINSLKEIKEIISDYKQNYDTLH